MRKILSVILSLCAVLSFALFFACGGNDSPTPDPNPDPTPSGEVVSPESIKIADVSEDQTIYYNDNKTVKFGVKIEYSVDEDLEVVWVTSDETVAEILSNGTLNIKKDGKITVSASVKAFPEIKDEVSVNLSFLAVEMDKSVLPQDNTFDMYNPETDVLIKEYGQKLTARAVTNGAEAPAEEIKFSSSDETVAVVSEDGHISFKGKGVTLIKAYLAGKEDIFDSYLLNVNFDTDKLREKNLLGIFCAGSLKTGSDFYTIKEVTDGFLSSDGKIGFKIEKSVKTNAMSTYELKLKDELKAGGIYTFRYRVEQFSGVSAWGGFLFGVKDVIKQTGTSYPPSIWAVSAKSISSADDSSEFITSAYSSEKVTDETGAELGLVYDCLIKFKVGENDVKEPILNLVVNFGSNAGKVIITHIDLEKYEPPQATELAKKHLSGIVTSDIIAPNGFTITEITEGFEAAGAEVGLKITGNCSGNSEVIAIPTNVSVKSGKTYRFKYVIEGSGSWAQTFFGIKDVFTYPNASFPPNVWAYANNLGVKNATLVSQIKPSSKDAVYCGEVVFTPSADISEVKMYMMFQNSIDVIITELSVAEVS